MKLLSLILIFIMTNLAFSQGEFVIDQVVVSCEGKNGCSEIEEVFSSLKRKFSNLEHFYTVFKLYVSTEGIKELGFELDRGSNGSILNIDVRIKDAIVDVSDPNFKGNYEIDFPSVIPVKSGDFLDEKKIVDTARLFKDIAKENGFPRAMVRIEKKQVRKGVILKPIVDLGEPILIDGIYTSSKSEYLKQILKKKFLPYVNKPFNKQDLKLQLEELRKLFVQYGYYLVDFNFRYKRVKGRRVKIFFDVVNTKRYVFYLRNTPNKEISEIKDFLSESLISSKRDLNNESVEFLIKDYYDARGYKFIKVKSKLQKFNDLNDEEILNYAIDIDKGIQSIVASVQFKGNSYFSDNDLRNVFIENASQLASLGIYDFGYYETFKEVLRERYISNGFLSVKVDQPIIQFESQSKKVIVSFKIREGIRTTISNIKLKGLSFDDEMSIKKLLFNKKGQVFNPIEFKQDLTRIDDYLKKSGYYFAKIENANKKNIVRYFSDNSQVDISVVITTGPKIFADEILIIGNKKTRKILIKRELAFKSGSLLTKEAVEQSQSNLLRLGIFSTVRIKPVSSTQNKTDVLIFVKEKDFGLLEFAPGIRSDLGVKMTAAMTYNNLDGMNKRISTNLTINRRFDLFSLDDERRTSGLTLIEYDASINYLENNIFYSDYDFTLSTSQARRRFVSYDADIQRIGYTVSTNYYSWLSASLRQQLEFVSQFNATPTRDESGVIIDDSNHGQFQIGSFTPSVNMDFRNRAVNPTSGAELDFTLELANPFFFSQANDELTIDYYKFISRNKFYIPVTDFGVLAISAVFGVQENLASSEDYIPGIKVFRLVGADIVRGYEDNEINNLDNGNDISSVQVNEKAYMANIKIEPRYFLSDSMVLGAFYDAGRIFIGEFDETNLRSSVGISFKYVTPVGTLDIDYGIKTLRKTDSGGNLETPGRLHLSIGFF